jgi:hypothetical protein
VEAAVSTPALNGVRALLWIQAPEAEPPFTMCATGQTDSLARPTTGRSRRASPEWRLPSSRPGEPQSPRYGGPVFLAGSRGRKDLHDLASFSATICIGGFSDHFGSQR